MPEPLPPKYPPGSGPPANAIAEEPLPTVSNQPVNPIAQWIVSQKISAHSITAIMGVVAIVWAADPAARTAFHHLWDRIPTDVHDILVFVAVVIATYYKSTKGDS
jgi:hypothetical protein